MSASYPDPQRRAMSESPLVAAEDHFTLAAFGFNNRGGMWFTSSENTPRATWE